jgi:tRNA threonylcarbamoyladenosine biosynthesis protein TsaB
MKTLLALDSSSKEGVVVLRRADGCIFSHKNIEVQRHNAFLLPAIQDVLRAAQVRLDQVDYIACGVGPGSFVGTRLAVSVAQGLAYGLKKPLLALNHLNILKHMAQRKYGVMNPAIALDAKMQAFYFLDALGHTHFYRLTLLSQAQQAELCSLPNKIGDAWPLLGITASLPLIELSPEDLCQEAEQQLQQGQIIHTPSTLLPIYLNDQDNWKKL